MRFGATNGTVALIPARTLLLFIKISPLSDVINRSTLRAMPDNTGKTTLSVVRFFGTSELIEHWRALAHLVQVMPLGRDGSSGGFEWSVS